MTQVSGDAAIAILTQQLVQQQLGAGASATQIGQLVRYSLRLLGSQMMPALPSAADDALGDLLLRRVSSENALKMQQLLSQLDTRKWMLTDSDRILYFLLALSKTTASTSASVNSTFSKYRAFSRHASMLEDPSSSITVRDSGFHDASILSTPMFKRQSSVYSTPVGPTTTTQQSKPVKQQRSKTSLNLNPVATAIAALEQSNDDATVDWAQVEWLVCSELNKIYHGLQGPQVYLFRWDSAQNSYVLNTVQDTSTMNFKHQTAYEQTLKAFQHERSGRKVQALLTRMAEMGTLYKRVQLLMDAPSEHRKGLIRQNFDAAIKTQLGIYHRFLTTLEYQFLGADSKKQAEKPNERCTTLVKLWIWCTKPVKQLRTLLEVLELCKNAQGCRLLNAIYDVLQTGDPVKWKLAHELLQQASRPFFKMMIRWLSEGVIEDPFEEFFIGVHDGTAAVDLWQSKYFLRDRDHLSGCLPAFMTTKMTHKVLLIGKSLDFLRTCCHDRYAMPAPPSESLTVSNMLPVLGPYIDRQYAVLNEYLIRMLSDKHGMVVHLKAVKDYILLAQGDFVKTFFELLREDLDGNVYGGGVYRHSVTSKLEQALRSSCFSVVSGIDFNMGKFQPSPISPTQSSFLFGAGLGAHQYANSHSKSADVPEMIKEEVFRRLDVRLVDPNQDESGWDIFSLTYHLEDSPLHTLFDPKTMSMYRKVFCHLGRVWRVKMEMERAWMRQRVVYRMVQRVGTDLDLDSLLITPFATPMTSPTGMGTASSGLERKKRKGDAWWLRKVSTDLAAMISFVSEWMRFCLFEGVEQHWIQFMSVLKSFEGSHASTGSGSMSDVGGYGFVGRELDLARVIEAHKAYLEGILAHIMFERGQDSPQQQQQDSQLLKMVLQLMSVILEYCQDVQILLDMIEKSIQRVQDRTDRAYRQTAQGQWGQSDSDDRKVDLNRRKEVDVIEGLRVRFEKNSDVFRRDVKEFIAGLAGLGGGAMATTLSAHRHFAARLEQHVAQT